MEEMSHKVSDAELIKALLSWRLDNISSDQLRLVVDRYLAVRPNARTNFEDVSNTNTLADQPESQASRTFEAMEAEDALRSAAATAYKSPSFEAYETVPYIPIADVVQERHGAWIPDGWGLYYSVDDYLNRVSRGFLSILNLAMLFGFLVVAGVLFGAWQISMSNERQKKATFKPMSSSSTSRDKQRDAPKSPIPTTVGRETSPEETSSVSGTSGTPPSNTASASPAPERSPAVAATSERTKRTEQLKSVEPELNKATVLSPFDKITDLLAASNSTDALREIEALEAGGQTDLQPMLTFLKVEALLEKLDSESMELARQLLMDCKSSGHELAYDLLVSRWMLLCGADSRERFLRESASLPIESRSRMVNWAKVRSGASDAVLQSELESNAPRTPNSVCDRLFLASCHLNAGMSEQTRRELLDVEQKLRALNTRGFGKVEVWLIESSKKQLVEKVAEIVTSIGRK